MALPRQRRRCAGCGRHSQPDDAVLAPELGTGQLSPHLRELALLCGASWPYRQAADVLGRLRGVPLSVESVRAVVGTAGTRVATAQAAEAATAVAPPATSPGAGRAVPARIEVELDGAWVHSPTTMSHGLEVKVGVVHGRQRLGRGRHPPEPRQRTYAATAQGVAAFGPLMTAVIEARNGFAAALQTLLGDGAGVDLAAGGRTAAGGDLGCSTAGISLTPGGGPCGRRSPTRPCARRGAHEWKRAWSRAM